MTDYEFFELGEAAQREPGHLRPAGREAAQVVELDRVARLEARQADALLLRDCFRLEDAPVVVKTRGEGRGAKVSGRWCNEGGEGGAPVDDVGLLFRPFQVMIRWLRSRYSYIPLG